MKLILLIILNLLIIFFINKFRLIISQKTTLIDIPDKIRKFHKTNTPLLGGIMIYSTFFLLNLYLFSLYEFNKINLTIFIASSCCFSIGLFDDIFKISYKYKFTFLTLFLYFFLAFEPNLQITKIYFLTFDKFIYLNNYSIFFTTVCLMLLINSINLIDGIDGLCVLIIIIFYFSIIIYFENNFLPHVVMIITLLYVLFLNLKKNIFVGDSGSLFLGSLVGLLMINNYNDQISITNYPVENIFIILMLPGIDMFRVFIQRALKNKNPFTPDRIHMHYLLLDKNLKLNNVLVIFLALILIPIFINLFTNIPSYQIILAYIMTYILLIFFLYRKKNN